MTHHCINNSVFAVQPAENQAETAVQKETASQNQWGDLSENPDRRGEMPRSKQDRRN